ncbi:bromodomain-containing protein DDB_G0280777 [Anastrepha obliqua]|uniref:bromodomain-containing protein DDB_G0280777 n=1 Tax=Anastrepha obliqua TaxID=95512 RepID=UPI0024090D2D|nr:bromodomain-containing protein DDB_G0280777 [Anastrepha obliqua]XP_054734368.1 bromodomain-containing protein DDB_G0280777 [Anastrepha obliqua]
MAATTRNNPNDENAESGGSGTQANTSNNNNNNSSCNNNNNGDSTSHNQPVMDEMEIKLKRQNLEQRKQELERVLSEKNWLLQQIQKQETQILNGNYEYLNVNEIFAMLTRQYKKENGGSRGSDAGSTAVLRRKTISGGCKENQINHNNSSNNNRQSEISNRSSEYDNYPGGNSSMGESNTTALNAAAVQQHLTKSQSMKKRGTNTPAATSMANYNYLQAQQRQQQLLQQQMLQNQMQYTALMQHQHYHHQQQQLHQHQKHEDQQQQAHQYKQQISPSQSQSYSQSRHYPSDAISLYSVNSASVATLRQQHIAPQQQPIVVQCDRYYLSPTHQSYNGGGFIKSSQNIKKYVSPQVSPTHHGVATTQTLKHSHPFQQDLLIPAAVTAEQKYMHHQQLPLQQQQFLTLQQLQPQILLHQPQHASSRQLDAISLAPSYISVDVESAAAHNPHWRSQSNLPPISPQTPPHKGLAYNQNQITADTKSHSSDMLSSNAYYNTSVALPAASVKSLTKPLDEISISSLNSETQKSKLPKPKQWMESSLDGPVIRQTPTTGGSAAHAQDLFYNTSNSSRPSANKTQIGVSTLGGGGASAGGPRERTKLSSQSMSGAPRHYSMSAASHKHPYSQKLLQDDDGRYAKLSQSTSYLNSRESPSISAAYPLDGSMNSTTIELPAPTTVFKYLPPKPSTVANTASQLTPPPPPRPPPIGEKAIGVVVTGVATMPSALSPNDIRIESPKNITVVKPATFRPYQEETKPFEMSDFYKYSTKFRQKEPSASNAEH